MLGRTTTENGDESVWSPKYNLDDGTICSGVFLRVPSVDDEGELNCRSWIRSRAMFDSELLPLVATNLTSIGAATPTSETVPLDHGFVAVVCCSPEMLQNSVQS
eukprot:927962-Rhodomonas_salina.1